MSDDFRSLGRGLEQVAVKRRNAWVGIDVGLDGAIAAIIDDDPPVIFEMPTDTIKSGTAKKPIKRRVLNGFKVRHILQEIQVQVTEMYVLIERAQLRPALRRDAKTGETRVNQGVASQAMFMEQYGVLCGIMIGLGIPHETIHPATWKAAIFHGSSEKTDARLKASSLFPSIADRFARVKDDGNAEAALIADYGRRRHSAPF